MTSIPKLDGIHRHFWVQICGIKINCTVLEEQHRRPHHHHHQQQQEGEGGINCLHQEKSHSMTNGNANFKVENIDIDEFLCENNLNLNEIDQFSNHFESLDQTRSSSPHGNGNGNGHGNDPLLLHSPMQAAPAKSPLDDSMSIHCHCHCFVSFD